MSAVYSYRYPRPAVTVDAIVMAAGNQLLLIRRKKDPYAGMWALPGGFMDMNETLEEACSRELYEETGLKLPQMKQFRVFDAPDRDPRQRTLSVVHFANVDYPMKANGGDDASEARWFPVDQLPDLAFDHSEIISCFLSVLRNNIPE